MEVLQPAQATPADTVVASRLEECPVSDWPRRIMDALDKGERLRVLLRNQLSWKPTTILAGEAIPALEMYGSPRGRSSAGTICVDGLNRDAVLALMLVGLHAVPLADRAWRLWQDEREGSRAHDNPPEELQAFAITMEKLPW